MWSSLDWEDTLNMLDQKNVQEVFKFVLNPRTKTIDYESNLFSGGLTLPPQPKEEVIAVKDICEAVSSKHAVEAFLSVDEIVSLLPFTELNKLRMDFTQHYEEFCKWVEKLSREKRKFFSKRQVLRMESDKKKKVLMIIPSKKQLGVVEGNWVKYVWSRYTVNGEKAPDAEKWMDELIKIGESLVNEKVTPVYAVDNEEKEVFLEKTGKKFSLIPLNMPKNLPKIGYSRDQSVFIFDKPIICNMALSIRQGEEYVLNEIYWILARKEEKFLPVTRPRWSLKGNFLVKAKLEGGNFIVVDGEGKKAVFTGLGVRGSNVSAIKLISSLLPKETPFYAVPLSGYIKDWKSKGTVHLDVAMHYVGFVNGVNLALIDPGRVGFYSVLEYEEEKEAFQVKSFGEIIKELNLVLDEPLAEKKSKITMVNALNLGSGKLMVDPYNKEVNQYLEKKWGLDLIKIPIPQLEAGGGGIRCATREIEYS